MKVSVKKNEVRFKKYYFVHKEVGGSTI